jgi:rhodanese-related sulfurtransferase
MSGDVEISVEALAELLALPENERPVLLDVRRPEEHMFVAIPGSTLIPLHDLREREKELKAWGQQLVVVYCHHGIRSLQGVAVLRGLGLQALSLSGGIDRYSAKQDPSLPRY